jgi:hypothetical protein
VVGIGIGHQIHRIDVPTGSPGEQVVQVVADGRSSAKFLLGDVGSVRRSLRLRIADGD